MVVEEGNEQDAAGMERERVCVYSFLARHIGKHEILPEFQIVEVTNIVS